MRPAGSNLELPGQNTAFHSLEPARVPEHSGIFAPNALGEHAALHRFELALVPERSVSLAPNALGEHAALHRFELALVPERRFGARHLVDAAARHTSDRAIARRHGE